MKNCAKLQLIFECVSLVGKNMDFSGDSGQRRYLKNHFTGIYPPGTQSLPDCRSTGGEGFQIATLPLHACRSQANGVRAWPQACGNPATKIFRLLHGCGKRVTKISCLLQRCRKRATKVFPLLQYCGKRANRFSGLPHGCRDANIR